MNFWQIILIAGFAFAIFGALSPFIVSYAQKKIQSDEVLGGELTNLILYPKAKSVDTSKMLLPIEGFLDRSNDSKTGTVFYGLLSQSDDIIKSFPKAGIDLLEFKKDYYQYKTRAESLQNNLSNFVSDNAIALFPQARNIYIIYVLNRYAGIDQAKHEGRHGIVPEEH
jgi:hypothetical protein